MFNRLYEKVKTIMKENYKGALLLLLLYGVLMYPLDYYIVTGGGTIDTKNRVQIKNSYKQKGSLHLAYVEELKGNVATYLLSYIIPHWERTSANLYKIEDKEDIASVDFRSRLELEESINAAIKVSYEKANKKFVIENEHIYIIYVSEKNDKNLKVGDELKLVAGEKIKDLDALREMIETYEVGDKVKLTILRDKKEKEVEAEVYLEEGRKILGISIIKSYDYKTDPELKLIFNKSESGPSGGMMLSLDIYNKLTKKDITKGYKIVGTGTIDEKGKVGEIGGVEYKLMGAVKEKADIFIAPSGSNYKEAKKIAKKKKYKIKIIEAKTIDNVLEELEKLPNKKK